MVVMMVLVLLLLLLVVVVSVSTRQTLVPFGNFLLLWGPWTVELKVDGGQDTRS